MAYKEIMQKTIYILPVAICEYVVVAGSILSKQQLKKKKKHSYTRMIDYIQICYLQFIVQN